MLLRDIMTTNVVTISGDMPVTEARETMKAHKIERIPVAEKGKLVGLVTKENLLRIRPSPATSLSVWEVTTLLSKIKVKDIMVKDIVTANPDMTVESAISLAQGKKVGCLPIVEQGKLVGIVTTNDFFYKILNPLLGIGEPGTRIYLRDVAEAKDKQEVYATIAQHGAKVITSLYVTHPETEAKDWTIHLNTENADNIVKDLGELGYKIEVRERTP